MIARWRPVHLGHVVVLCAFCDYAAETSPTRQGIPPPVKPRHPSAPVPLRPQRSGGFSGILLGIGSANRYDLRNPFTLAETTDMICLTLPHRQNHALLPVPGIGGGLC